MTRTVCRNCNTAFDIFNEYEKHMEVMGWNGACKKMKRITCDCSVADKCPQGKCGAEHRCTIWVKEQKRMTREEAVNRCFAALAGQSIKISDVNVNQLITMLENLGLIKFDEPKKVIGQIVDKYGTISLEEWSEGLVLWVGGEIVWKSWHEYADITNPVKR